MGRRLIGDAKPHSKRATSLPSSLIDDEPILFSDDGEQSTQQHVDDSAPAPPNML
jgi:hypothetical protein